MRAEQYLVFIRRADKRSVKDPVDRILLAAQPFHGIIFPAGEGAFVYNSCIQLCALPVKAQLRNASFPDGLSNQCLIRTAFYAGYEGAAAEIYLSPKPAGEKQESRPVEGVPASSDEAYLESTPFSPFRMPPRAVGMPLLTVSVQNRKYGTPSETVAAA